MTGLVSNLLPGQTRVTMLDSPVRYAVPDSYDDVEFEIELEQPNPASEATALVTLGSPTPSADRFGITTMSVPVTNGDAAAHTLAVGAAQTATVSIGVFGSTAGADQVLVTSYAVLR